MDKKKIMIIDGNSIVSRAFYGIPLLTNKDNEYTNAIYGFLNIFIKLFDDEKPDYVAIAFDLPVKTFRHKLFSEYKGTRKPMPDELRPQIPALKNLLEKMNIRLFEVAGYEADDVLGTLSVHADNAGLNCILVSGDKDMLQLATDKVQVKIPKTKGGKTITESYYHDDVVNTIGVTPKEFIDMKALMGDTSDNIPGVPGIGEKTALKIIQEYHSIENAIENASVVKPPRASKNLQEFKEQAILSKELATIILDVPIDFNLEELEVSSESIFNEEASKEVMRFSLKKLLTRFNKHLNVGTQSYSLFDTMDNTSDIQAELKDDFNILKSISDMSDYIQNITSISAYSILEIDDFFAFSIVSGTNKHCICVNNDVSKVEIIKTLKVYFEGENPKITLDYKNDLTFLNNICVNNNIDVINVNNVVFDGSLASYLLNPSSSNYDYDHISLEYLEEAHISCEDILGKGKSVKKSDDISNNTLYNLVFNRADVIFRAMDLMLDELRSKELTDLFNNIEMPLSEALSSMETVGMTVDKNALFLYGENLKKHIDILTGQIYELADEEFNINSPTQLGVILFEKLNLSSGNKAKLTKSKKGYSTSIEVLEKLKGEHEIIDKIIEYRTYSKLNSTYVDGLLSVIHEKTSKIHSTFNQTITTTGRISSTEPNLQNIPIRFPIGREIRKVFVPISADYTFLDADYSQIELRVLAHLSCDETLINAFKENQDIHRLTASHVFNTPFDEVTEAQRRNAKAVNFGIVYGISAFSLSQDLMITKKEADEYISSYFDRYPKIKSYLDNSIAFAHENGYALTMFNRRRYIPELRGNFIQRGFGERVAMNMPVQGTAADIIKLAMIKVHNRLLLEKLDARVILQVHDELLLETNVEIKDIVSAILKEEMESATTLLVPLLVDVNEGNTWFDCK